MSILDNSIKQHLTYLNGELETHMGAAIGAYIGPIDPAYVKAFRALIEAIKASCPDKKKLALLVQSPGGSVEAVEKMVEIMRHHFEEVYFIVPEMAMSAGTILCMSGDKIFMDYASSLGPIDPQVQDKGGHWVPALGYLDQFEKLIEKSNNNNLSAAEYGLIQGFDLARLRRYEQAREISVTLLKEWLVQYKFKDWTEHRTDEGKKGQPVTQEEKQNRAEEIAGLLGNHNHWHSHSRMISMKTLREVIKLEIDDYSIDADLNNKIRPYFDLLLDYVQRHNISVFCNGRDYF